MSHNNLIKLIDQEVAKLHRYAFPEHGKVMLDIKEKKESFIDYLKTYDMPMSYKALNQ